jgi:hypothetical protein
MGLANFLLEILQAMEVVEATRAKKTTKKQAVRESLGRSLTGSSS